MITESALKLIMPKCDVGTYVPILNTILTKYNINSFERITAFIAQTAHESGEYKWLVEFADGKAYEFRKDLGNTKAGDGVKYKGRGLIQVTGRFNYERCSLYLFNDKRLINNPELLEQPKYAVASACWFWYYKQLNEICDKPNDWFTVWRNVRRGKFEYLTIKINGGLNGYNDRLKYYLKARDVLSYLKTTHIDPLPEPRGLEKL